MPFALQCWLCEASMKAATSYVNKRIQGGCRMLLQHSLHPIFEPSIVLMQTRLSHLFEGPQHNSPHIFFACAIQKQILGSTLGHCMGRICQNWTKLQSHDVPISSGLGVRANNCALSVVVIVVVVLLVLGGGGGAPASAHHTIMGPRGGAAGGGGGCVGVGGGGRPRDVSGAAPTATL